jgi:mono/diheme cytochrome c family protein
VKRLGWIAACALVAAVVALVVFVNRVPRSPLEAGAASATTAGGEYVQRLADCMACHSVPGGAPFAGGLKMGTPLGVLYTTNITPDPDTGIGRYSPGDFDNAVRRGVAKDGHRLYPAMPYPSYAKLTDDDVRKLYDFFMHEVRPAHLDNRPPEISFPLDQRWGLAWWDAWFLHEGSYRPKTEHDAAWNRGAYLVQGPGHCGSCHTPRGWAFNEVALDDRSERYLEGALLDGWYASNLRGDRLLGLGQWSESDIVSLLKSGHNSHATVYGSMLDAFNNSTQFMTDEDLSSIAHYLKSLDGGRTGAPSAFVYDGKTAQALDGGDLGVLGAGLYLNQCSACHGLDGKGRGDLLPPLAGNTSALERDPSSLIDIVLNGAGRIVVNGIPDSYRMTPFRVLLSDQDIADVATFVRSSWGNNGPPVTAAQVRTMRAATDPTSDRVIVLRIR